MSTRTRFAVALVAISAAAAFAQNTNMAAATVPVKVNVAANVVLAPIAGVDGTGAEGAVTANGQKNFDIQIATGYSTLSSSGGPVSGVSSRPSGRLNASAQISRGNVTLNLPMRSYSDAVISLYSVKGNQVLSGKASASNAKVLSSNLPAGVYLLAVRGQSGNFFTTRLTHSGDMLNINAAFVGADNFALYKTDSDYWQWTVTVSANGYFTETRTIRPEPGMNPLEEFTLKAPTATAKANFTETVGSLSFDMVYIPGGTFTIGCEASSGCPANTRAVEGVRVSNYYIAKTTVTTALWNAVMEVAPCVPNYQAGVFCPSTSGAYGSMTWFDAMTFACKLSEKTGRHYRMASEAEWEYAAKKHLSSLTLGSSTEEWAYNTWSGTHSGGTDPLGNNPGSYDQKTRRNAQGVGDNITGRLIRSIEGVGPALRLVISADSDYPPGYVAPCNLHMPEIGPEPENSYRDPRWVTGSGAQWEAAGQMADFQVLNLRVWDDGTARLSTGGGGYVTSTNGQWFTSNNIALVFVSTSSSGTVSRRKFAYIFLDGASGSLIADNYTGRIARRPADNYAKPTISGLKSGAELAAEAGDDYKMWDMENIPAAAKKQDARLLDGPDSGWSQKNAGSAHHYRKDVDPDEFRFTVNQNGQQIILANGTWFTLNNTFLRVTHRDGYTCNYLYLVTSGGQFYHNSFMGYERGDFRSFTKTKNGPDFNNLCGSVCDNDIPKGLDASMYAPGGYMSNVGHSTYVPAKCPASGCY